MTSTPTHSTQLHGAWLTLARVGWFVILLVTLGLYFAAIPLRIEELGQICYDEATCDPSVQLTPGAVQGLAAQGLSIETYVTIVVISDVLFTLAFVIVAILVFWRRSDDWMAMLVSVMLMTFSVFLFSAAVNPLAARDPVLLIVNIIFQIIGGTSIVLFFFLFPDGRFVPRWSIWLVPVFVVREVLNVMEIGTELWLLGALFFIELITFLGAQIYRYRSVSTPQQRQQTKWVVFGVGAALSIVIVMYIYFGVIGDTWPQAGITSLLVVVIMNAALALMPISIGIAILRSRLWDIDILIRRTVTYALVTALLVAIFFASVVILQQVFAALINTEQNDLITVLSTLAIAALFIPLRNRIQALIDRRFYRKKYDAQKVLQMFGESVRDETDLERLTGRLVEVVEETMQPASVSVWLREMEHKAR